MNLRAICSVVALSATAALLSTLVLAQGSSYQIGSEKAVPVHLADGQEYDLSLQALNAYGRKLFVARFTSQVALRARPAQARNTTELTLRLRSLFAEWHSLRGARAKARSNALRDRVDGALSGYVLGRLAERPLPSAVRLREQLDYALRSAIWGSVFGLSPEAIARALTPGRPAFTRVLRGTGASSKLYAAAFPIGYGNVFVTRVHGFAPGPQGYHPVGPVSALDGAVSGAIRLDSFGPGEMRFVLWSLHVGSPEGLASVVVYSFDGRQLRVLFDRPSVSAAKVSLDRGLVIIESKEPPNITHNDDLWAHTRQTFKQVPSGLKLLRTERWTSR